jgi:pectin methylesterase-like acyl-CoA thioesterase
MNRTTDRLLLAMLLLLAVASLRCPSKATVAVTGRPALPEADLVVAEDGSTDYETIGDALDDAEEGNVILIKPGLYQEEIEIDEDAGPFTLVGEDPATTVIDADGEYAALTLKSSGNHISGLTIKGGESHGIYIPGGKQEIDYCLIIDNDDRGIYISTMAGGGSATIDHCTVADNKVSGIYCANKNDKTTITNSIFADNKRSLVYDGDGLNLVVNYSCLKSTDTDSDEAKSGSNSIRKDPKFRDHENGNYRLKSGSPCEKAAEDGSNMGCF